MKLVQDLARHHSVHHRCELCSKPMPHDDEPVCWDCENAMSHRDQVAHVSRIIAGRDNR